MGCIGLLLDLYGNNTALAMASLTLASVGILTTLPLFWSLPTAFLSGTAAAAGIALINSLGNLAGFVSPSWSAGSRTPPRAPMPACTCWRPRW
jgi:hypothetical protein